MAGEFDDLIPAARGEFDDLIPAKSRAPSKGDSWLKTAEGIGNKTVATVGGMGVDAVQNAYQVAKGLAALPYLLSGHAADAPSWITNTTQKDRESAVGSSANIERGMQGAGFQTTPGDPNDPAQRLVHTAGVTALSSALMSPEAPAAAAASGAASGAGSELVPDKYGPGWKMVAGTLAGAAPQAAKVAGAGAVRGALGADPNTINANLDELNAAGVTRPDAGLATGSPTAQMVTSYLSKVPGSAGAMRSQLETNNNAVGAEVTQIADQLAPARGTGDAASAGRAIRTGYTDFWLPGFKRAAGGLFDTADAVVPQGHTVNIAGTLRQLDGLVRPLDGLPETTRVTNEASNNFVTGLRTGLDNDIAALHPAPAQPPQFVSDWQTTPPPNYTPPPVVDFRAAVALRQRIGQMLETDPLQPTPAPRAQLKTIYRELSQDITASLADNPAAQAAQQRASRFYSAGMDRIDRMYDLVNRGTDESIFSGAMSGAAQGGSQLATVMRSVPASARPVIAASWLRRLGQANPGAQNAAGTEFSANTFLTNWNKVSDAAKRQLYGAMQPDMIEQLNLISRYAERTRTASGVYANPSGTAPAESLINAGKTLGIGVAGAAGALATGGSVGMGAAAAAGPVLAWLGSNRAGAALMFNPRFIRWLAGTTHVDQSALAPMLATLGQQAQQTRDPQLAAATQALAQLVGPKPPTGGQ